MNHQIAWTIEFRPNHLAVD